jgi:hypothetical protein
MVFRTQLPSLMQVCMRERFATSGGVAAAALVLGAVVFGCQALVWMEVRKAFEHQPAQVAQKAGPWQPSTM